MSDQAWSTSTSRSGPRFHGLFRNLQAQCMRCWTNNSSKSTRSVVVLWAVLAMATSRCWAALPCSSCAEIPRVDWVLSCKAKRYSRKFEWQRNLFFSTQDKRAGHWAFRSTEKNHYTSLFRFQWRLYDEPVFIQSGGPRNQDLVQKMSLTYSSGGGEHTP